MKKPLMSVPPAQAEALYDAALIDSAKIMASKPLRSKQGSQSWELQEWADDERMQTLDVYAGQTRLKSVNAQH